VACIRPSTTASTVSGWEVVEVRGLAALVEQEAGAAARGVPPYMERVCTTMSLSVQ
jgi:hypothetical protein